MKHAFLFLLIAVALSSCSSGVNTAPGNFSVTGGVSGKVQTTDGKDMNYDLHGTWVAPTPTPAATPPAAK